MRNPKVLIIDDDDAVRFGVREFLQASGFEVCEAATCQDGIGLAATAHPDVAIVDYMLPDGTALELVPRLREMNPTAPCVVLTAHGTIDLAVSAIKVGAEQFLTKPVDLGALHLLLQRLVEVNRGRRSERAGRSQQMRRAVNPFLGGSARIRDLAAQAIRVKCSDSPIILLGETGAGKGVLARWLHDAGPRSEEPFVDLNCAGMSREFLETELFGHERGAFTGAVQSKMGLLEVAHRGTVFFDEIGEMDLQVQAKLLNVIEEKRFRRLGDVRDRSVDIRLIAATHQDLDRLIAERRFREDLYFRINTLTLTVPALRDRPEDIPALAKHLLGRLAADLGRSEVKLGPDAIEALTRHPFPGNVRELKNVLERSLMSADQPTLGAQDLRFDVRRPAHPTIDTSLTLAELERRYIAAVLAEEDGRVQPAAQRLGVPRSSLYEKMKRYGLSTRTSR